MVPVREAPAALQLTCHVKNVVMRYLVMGYKNAREAGDYDHRQIAFTLGKMSI